jgi:hypothetical protein
MRLLPRPFANIGTIVPVSAESVIRPLTNLSLRKRKKSRGRGILAWKALLDWNEFNLSNTRAEGIT